MMLHYILFIQSDFYDGNGFPPGRDTSRASKPFCVWHTENSTSSPVISTGLRLSSFFVYMLMRNTKTSSPCLSVIKPNPLFMNQII